MIPIIQTKIGINGNCFAACIASIFEIKIIEAPNLMPEPLTDGDTQTDILNKWLYNYNLKYIEIGVAPIKKVVDLLNGVYHVIIGRSPLNKNLDHCVVGCGGIIIHDPHPDEIGIEGFKKFGIFISLNPKLNYEIPKI